MRGHKGAKADISLVRLKHLVSYAPKTGIFTWRVLRKGITQAIGKTAGWTQAVNNRPDRLRVKLCLDGEEYMAHRLAWLYMTGKWPEEEVDHIDGDGTNNRWKNLREATSHQNMVNRGLQSNNRTGVRGVCFDNTRKKFLATIKIGRKQRHIGHFATLEEAKEARLREAKKFHGDFYHEDD